MFTFRHCSAKNVHDPIPVLPDWGKGWAELPFHTCPAFLIRRQWLCAGALDFPGGLVHVRPGLLGLWRASVASCATTACSGAYLLALAPHGLLLWGEGGGGAGMSAPAQSLNFLPPMASTPLPALIGFTFSH